MLRLAPVVPLLLLTACGYMGEPLPPALNIPTRITDLAAVERGEKLIIQFTRPATSTEGLVLKRPPHLDLTIGPSNGAPFNPALWASGAKHFSDLADTSTALVRFETPAAAWYGKDVVIGVKALNESGHDAGWSNFVTLPVIAALATPSDLQTRNVAEGVQLTWKAPPGNFRVFRRGSKEAAWSPLGTVNQSSYTDTSTEYGKTYQYLVQAIHPVSNTIVESELSGTADITPHDDFAPAVPAGLTVVAGPQSIELVWDRNTEPDLAGYRVYRAASPGANFAQMGDTQESPSFSDRKIEAGKRYRYAVSAVDKSGNESKMSAPVEAGLP